MDKQMLSFAVANEVLKAKGEFTVTDIFKRVKSKITISISDDDLKEYIRKKMDYMVDDGILFGTDTYYFNNDK